VGTSLGSWHDFLEKFEVGALGVFSRSLAIVDMISLRNLKLVPWVCSRDHWPLWIGGYL